jgi:hypothetical protein
MLLLAEILVVWTALAVVAGALIGRAIGSRQAPADQSQDQGGGQSSGSDKGDGDGGHKLLPSSLLDGRGLAGR